MLSLEKNHPMWSLMCYYCWLVGLTPCNLNKNHHGCLNSPLSHKRLNSLLLRVGQRVVALCSFNRRNGASNPSMFIRLHPMWSLMCYCCCCLWGQSPVSSYHYVVWYQVELLLVYQLGPVSQPPQNQLYQLFCCTVPLSIYLCYQTTVLPCWLPLGVRPVPELPLPEV